MRKKTHAEFVAEVEALVGDEYTVVGEYKNTDTIIEIKHNICGQIFTPRPSAFKRGTRCKPCYLKTITKSHEDFVYEVSELVGDEYTVLSAYTTAYNNVKIRHNDCAYVYSVPPNRFLRGTRCAKCAGNILKTHEEFVSEVSELVGDEYLVVGEYTRDRIPVLIRHNTCSQEYHVRPRNFLAGNRCPACNESKGERSISVFLQKHNIETVREIRYSACKDVLPLPFDFGVKQCGNVVGLIEYDGLQHFEVVDHFGGESTFHGIQSRDAIKTQYCADNGIPLIRIPYWDFDNIETILTEKLLPLLKDADKHNAS